MAATNSPASRERRTAISRAQEGLWFLDRLNPSAPAMILRRAYRVTGELDAGGLERAWRAVTERHRILRTRIRQRDGRPVPRVSPLAPAATGRLLDLADGPVAGLTVVRTGPSEHRVLLEAHRAVADRASLALLAGELSTAYGTGRAPAVHAPRYADYLRWEGRARWQRARRFWDGALTAPPPALPFDRGGGAPVAVPFDWGPGAAARVAALADRCGTTSEIVLLAAFHALLSRYSGGGAVPVTVPMDARPAGFERTVGPLENPVVVCGDASGGPSFAELVARVARAHAEAHRHRTLPFAEAIRSIRADRDPDRVPWGDATFVPPVTADGALVLGDARAELLPAADTELADLWLSLDEARRTVRGRLGYRVHPHAPAPAAMLDHLRTLVQAAAADPDVPIGDLPLEDRALRPDDRLGADAPREPVHTLIGRHRDGTAMTWPDGRLPYRTLMERAAALASRLAGIGVDRAPVAIRMGHGPAQLTASLATHLAGGHVVWFGPGDAGERGRSVLTELRPACLVTETPDAPLERWYRDHLGGTLLLPSDPAPDGAAPVPVPPSDLDRLAYAAYTSGSTGKPKGIAQTHGALVQFAAWLADECGIDARSRVALWVAPEHDPSLCEIFATLVAGGTLCVVPDRLRLNPEPLLEWLRDERITFLQTVPSFAAELLRAARDHAGGWPRTLDRVALMGEALPAGLVNGLRAAAPHARVFNGYGPTETIAATWHRFTGPVAATVPIGRPIPGRQVLVLDGDDRPCPAGVTGEIVIRSPYAAAGYLGGDDAGAFRPVRGMGGTTRCYRTGDLGRWGFDGTLEFRGRRDHQVKLGGNRVEISGVEAELAAHPSVRECAVVPVTGDHGLVTHLLAYVVPRDGAEAAPHAWRAHLNQRLGASVRLIAFHVLEAGLPRNIAGKVDRRRLPDPARVLSRRGRAPASDTERELARIWHDLLGAAPETVEESFFSAGGHSLLVPTLTQRIHGRFGVPVSLRECLLRPSLAGMAALIESATVHSRPKNDDRRRDRVRG
ncbi:AMP-binding protein [Actinomadura sp. NEAU-AAG7]|uniref:AMP-binding protein n=1 Tax=Actinomadura sp. NEAU-AAG7 TaxID=2839640 RepID=UPI001BE4BACE|nr:AMP-binding protein [Actinomadura sp. NEAU-AAG7]MBT2210200.1 AMP-binding protein [Actinomadura sp. NEAU-AAG7]